MSETRRYYSVINPSDDYSLAAESDEIAILATYLLGRGMYALEDEAGHELLPPLAFSTPEWRTAWFVERFNMDVADALRQVDRMALADCLDSLVIVKLKDRRLYELAEQSIDDPAKRQAWRDAWHDAQRTSLNNAGQWAWRLAARLRSGQPIFTWDADPAQEPSDGA